MNPRTVILGAGPAGLGAAFQITRRSLGPVTILEQNTAPGGSAGSFVVEGVNVDYGSHRLHPACDRRILRDLKELLGDDLLLRPRHGRIRLQGRWLRFPLEPLDLLLHLPPAFTAGAALDIVRRHFTRKPREDTYASVLERGLGGTISRRFFFPYARKIWGVEPEMLSAVQAHRRVSLNSPAKMLRKIAAVIPGLQSPGSNRYYYPRHGYGEISEKLADAIRQADGDLKFRARVTSLERAWPDWRVHYERSGDACVIECARVWSTLPITTLARCLPDRPAEILDAARRIEFRSLILIYLVLEQDRFSEFDAHYFPDEDVPLTRVSEPKNYSAVSQPAGITVLCGELVCTPNADCWSATDQQLGEAMLDWLSAAGIPVKAPLRRVVTRRIPQAYPLYLHGFEQYFDMIDAWVAGHDALLTFGRQGLYAHENLHHALHQGYSAADCLHAGGVFDQARWTTFRKSFEHHVVED